MNQYLNILSILLIPIFLLVALKSLERGIIFGVLIKPVIDTSWDIEIFSLSIIEIYSILFLVASFILIGKIKTFKNNTKVLNTLWFVAHLGIAFQLLIEPIDGLKSLLKALYFPLALFILPYFLIYSKQLNQKLIIRVLLIGALFSSTISILQFVGIIPYEYEHMSKGLQRANGFYHDMVTSRFYVLQGFLTLAYIKFSKRFSIKAWVSWVLLIIFLFSAYSLFSKALIGIILVGIFFLLVLTKQKFSHYLTGIILYIFLALINLETVIETTTTLFSSELEYNEGNLNDSSRLFSGRGGIWQEYISEFENATFLEQMIGFGKNTGHAHNEFLRVLILSGIIGLFAYVFFILKMIIQIVSKIFKSQLVFVAAFSLVIMLIDTMSVVWGLYPFYIIVIFGFYIAALHEIKITHKIKNKMISIW